MEHPSDAWTIEQFQELVNSDGFLKAAGLLAKILPSEEPDPVKADSIREILGELYVSGAGCYREGQSTVCVGPVIKECCGERRMCARHWIQHYGGRHWSARLIHRAPPVEVLWDKCHHIEAAIVFLYNMKKQPDVNH